MQSIPEIPIISSVCITSEDIIKSEYFLKGIDIILKQVPTFDKNYIHSIFEKIRNKQPLDVNEKKNLIIFVKNKKVSELGQKLLSKMKRNPININFKTIADLNSFSDLLKEIFSENGYSKIVDSIGEVAEIVELTLNRYKGFKRLIIKVNGEKREIYLENENLKVDSSTWKITTIKGVNVKINPEKDITEFIEGKLTGEQLFSWDAAIREAQKLGKRPPYCHSANQEFQAIIKKIGEKEFMKNFPGSRTPKKGEFSDNCSIYYWSASKKGENIYYNVGFDKSGDGAFIYWDDKLYGFSVRCVKD